MIFHVAIGNVTISMLADTGSSVTLIDKRTHQKLGCPPLQPTSIKVFTYGSSTSLELEGEMFVTITHRHRSASGVVLITKGDGGNILSGNMSSSLGLIQIANAITSGASNEHDSEARKLVEGQNGFARRIKASEVVGHEERTWYLLHHGVINPQKPSKVRVVFYASSRLCGQSLNDVLLKGSNLLNDVVDVLLLFRERAVSLSGDIKQMFLQVRVLPEDQSALRFLWRPPGTRSPPTIYQMQVQIFGSISSPFICSNVLQHNAELHRLEFPNVVDRIKRNFYVDNLLDSFDTEDEAIQASKDYSNLLKKGGFHLNQWISSSRKVLSSLPREDLSNPLLNIDLEDLPSERTLGVLYNSESDVFIFKINLDPEAKTKRRILSVVATIYDPLGFLSPIILIAKKILQEIWSSGCDWDDVVDEQILIQWKRWTDQLPQLEKLAIPRSITKSLRIEKCKRIQIHAFCDASTVGYGAVVYLRVISHNDDINLTFVLSKSRVAPLRPLTIPRLELQGAIVAVRLVKKIVSILRFPIP